MGSSLGLGGTMGIFGISGYLNQAGALQNQQQQIYYPPKIIFEPIYPLMVKYYTGQELFIWIP